MRRMAWTVLVDCGTRILVAKGAPEDVARRITEPAVETEAWGIPTHGLRIFSYFENFIGREIDPKAVPRIVRECGATALIDGNRAFGQLAMELARDLAMKKAREQGVAMVAVRDSFWLAGLAVHMLPLAEAGFLAQLWVQHSSGKDCAPFGGIEPRFSTNPVAFTFPAGDSAMVADFSTAIVAMGKVGDWIRKGHRPDEKMFIDSEGNLTDDPLAMKRGGSMLFAGGERHGYKGYAMSLWSEALTAMAGGRTNDPSAPSRQNWSLTVIDPDVFAGRDAYLAELRGFLARMKTSRLRPGFTEIRLPGERGFRSLADARRLGVPLPDETVAKLNELAARCGVAGL